MIDATISLADGRSLGYCDAGDREGLPVLPFHGSPGSRFFAPEVPDGVRLVTFDRPGYGKSTGNPHRTLRDVALDVAALLDALAIDETYVVSWSGGCVFGSAFAYWCASRVRALALVSGPGPLDEVPNAMQLLGPESKPGATMARAGEIERATEMVTRGIGPYICNPVAFLGSGRGPDAAVLNDPNFRPMLEAQMIEAISYGPNGIAQDLIAMWLPFGFALRDIEVPTLVFQGELDRHNHADTLVYSEQIPDATLTIWPGEAHFALLTRFGEVVDALRARQPLARAYPLRPCPPRTPTNNASRSL